MKHSTKLALVLVLAAGSAGTMAQMGDKKAMDMPMKEMPMMTDMPMGQAQGHVHKASGIVKKIDAAQGVATFAHGPVNSLNWPPMTMGFRVKDKAMLDTLAVGRQVEFEFVQEGSDYVVTAVR